VIKKITPVVILVVLLSMGYLVQSNPPEMNLGHGPDGPQTVVETLKIVPRNYQIKVNSYGTIQPQTQIMLVAQVSGQIMSVRPNFKPGGLFEVGEIIVTIDPRDYQANVSIAQAGLMDALQAEAQEIARVDQAKIDWERLGNANEQATDLVLRKPQLQAAKARVLSAKASLTKAKLNLERTTVTAPFSGRILKQMADLGQVVSVGTKLAEVYATDLVEVRLPLRNADLQFISLPEDNNAKKLRVEFTSEFGGVNTWAGEIVRTEGAIDEVSRQLHVVAQINDPFGVIDTTNRPLKVGEYVTAEIYGRKIPLALVIPSEAVYQNTYVYIVEEDILQRKAIEIAWQNGTDTIVSAGLHAGDRLVTTPLGQISSGTGVRVLGKNSAE